MNLFYYNGNQILSTNIYRENNHASAFLYLPGPSLNIVDGLNIYRPNLVSFAVNTAYPKVRPDVWIGMDTPSCYNNKLVYEPFMKIFRNGFQEQEFIGRKLSEFNNTHFATVSTPVSDVNDLFSNSSGMPNFAWLNHTLGVALHIIIYMGFKNIFLVGCDLGGEKDYYDDRVLDDKLRKSNRRLYASQVNFIAKISRLGKVNGVNLISCTPDSPINRYMDYIPLDEALDICEKSSDNDEKQVTHVLEYRKDRLMEQYSSFQWNDKVDLANGVIVGFDKEQEWMAEWWYDNYRKHNAYPVLFVDFGMTDIMVEWCKKKGHYVKMPDIDVKGWFKKPLACLLTIFKNSVWMDVDCEVRGNLSMLFRYAKYGFAIAEDINHKFTVTKSPINTGVVAFKHLNSVMRKWADDIISNEPFFRSDQEILEAMFENGNYDYIIIPPKFHTPRLMGKQENSVVVHWTGGEGKKYIQQQINVRNDIKRN